MICPYRKSTSAQAGSQHDSSRSAFTLLELTLVLVVIVALAGMAWPRITSFLQSESLLGNVEQVRQMLDHARVQAVEDGITYQFRFEPNGRKFVLLPYDLQVSEQQSGTSSTSTSQTSALGNQKRLPTVHELSEDCSFYMENSLSTGEITLTERLPDPWLEMLADGVMQRDVSWAPPIIYSPDGSATDGSVTIIDEDRRVITLSVRGLTGTVVTSRLAVLPETYGAMR